jgi:hypothetical protein
MYDSMLHEDGPAVSQRANNDAMMKNEKKVGGKA